VRLHSTIYVIHFTHNNSDHITSPWQRNIQKIKMENSDDLAIWYTTGQLGKFM